MASWLSSLALVLTAFLAFRPTSWKAQEPQEHVEVSLKICKPICILCAPMYSLKKGEYPEECAGSREEQTQSPCLIMNHLEWTLTHWKVINTCRDLSGWLFLSGPLLWPLCHTKNSLVNMPAIIESAFPNLQGTGVWYETENIYSELRDEVLNTDYSPAF